ncbi:esterase-like activity of phytase family protein [Mycobacterium sp. ITM-2016-00317]|uniref:esterase-like activity of phytase family protein n=1 Tax=Mycobacterium sp. ITM-2016-00317 TaxID=2099694 RepID=UPI00287F9DC0|nr:esterase-like activity of phytase family protein [Mycobacterium sp. ITM-2016-00317]WNG88884.1 esterase-like activity of phytase family protein [Mycobacterium sp. ITM-2016-00317]
MKRHLCVTLLAASVAAAGCTSTHTTPAALTYLGQSQVPHLSTVGTSVIGGLSGISYDPVGDVYYLVTDDQLGNGPTRFYVSRIELQANGIQSVEFLDSRPLSPARRTEFHAASTDTRASFVPPDPEGIAVDSRRQRIYWAGEGQRLVDEPNSSVLQDPSVRIVDFDGSGLGEFTMPTNLLMSADDHGPRQNLALEGLSLTPSGDSLFAAMEGPLFEDGPRPTPVRGALTRITRFDPDTLEPTAQYAYALDPVTSGSGGDNGLSDLLALDDSNFLILERGRGSRTSARIYHAEIGDAQDIMDVPALDGRPVSSMSKTLLADLAATPHLGPVANLEGMTLGPALPDGRPTVVAVSDDDFAADQVTQVLAFAVGNATCTTPQSLSGKEESCSTPPSPSETPIPAR